MDTPQASSRYGTQKRNDPHCENDGLDASKDPCDPWETNNLEPTPCPSFTKSKNILIELKFILKRSQNTNSINSLIGCVKVAREIQQKNWECAVNSQKLGYKKRRVTST